MLCEKNRIIFAKWS